MRAVKLVSGYVEFEGIGGFEDRFLSEIIGNNIEIWDFKTEDGIITGKVSARCYPDLVRLGKKNKIKIKQRKKHGAAFKINRHSSRCGIILGIIIFAVFTTVMSNFVWQIEVIGDSQIRAEKILEVVAQNGVKKGAFGLGLDLRKIEQKLLAEIDDLAWVGISKNKSKVIIDCRKRVEQPETVALYAPSNIIAECDGQIVDARVYKGTQLRWEDDSVKKGDILVSGIVTIGEGENAKDNYVHSRGEIIAKCPDTKYIKVPLTQTKTVKTGECEERKFLNLFGLNIPLFIAKPIDYSYSATSGYTPVVISGKELPLGITTNKYYKTTEQSVEFTEEQAKAEAYRQLDNYESSINKEGKILEKSTEYYIENGVFTVKSSYILEKNIAKQEILYIK